MELLTLRGSVRNVLRLHVSNRALTWAVIVTFGAFTYNHNKLTPADVPNTYAELVDPKWKGKLVLTNPNDDDAVCFLFVTIIEKYGWGWLDALAKQDVMWVRGAASPFFIMTAAAKDTNSTNADRILSITTAALAPGPLSDKNPVDSEERISFVQTVAILETTLRPETSKLFVAWLISKEWIEPMSGSGPVPLKSLDSVSPHNIYLQNGTYVSGYRTFSTDRTRVQYWMNQFEASIGTAQGLDPVVIY